MYTHSNDFPGNELLFAQVHPIDYTRKNKVNFTIKSNVQNMYDKISTRYHMASIAINDKFHEC